MGCACQAGHQPPSAVTALIPALVCEIWAVCSCSSCAPGTGGAWCAAGMSSVANNPRPAWRQMGSVDMLFASLALLFVCWAVCARTCSAELVKSGEMPTGGVRSNGPNDWGCDAVCRRRPPPGSHSAHGSLPSVMAHKVAACLLTRTHGSRLPRANLRVAKGGHLATLTRWRQRASAFGERV